MVAANRSLVPRRIILSALAGLLLAGCAQTKFGGKLVTVKLTSNQLPADAYLIPAEKFHNEVTREQLDLVCNKTNSRLRGPVPVTVKILAYSWVYVARLQTGQYSRPITFSPDELPDATIEAEFP